MKSARERLETDHPHWAGTRSDAAFPALTVPDGWRGRRRSSALPKLCLPKFHLFPCPLFTARTVGGETGRNDERFAEVMVEHDEAVVKTGVAIGQFEVVDGAAREFRLGEIFQIVTPVTEAAAERKRQVNFIQQFAARQQRVQNLPRIAELDGLSADSWHRQERTPGSGDFATRAEGAEREKRRRGDK